MRKYLLTAILILALMLSGCSGEEEPTVTLSLSSTMLAPGDELTLTLTNNSADDIYFGDQYSIERHDNGKWEHHKLPDVLWSDILRQLGPGQSFSQAAVLLPSQPGRYRIVKEYWHQDGNSRTSISAEFTVRN